MGQWNKTVIVFDKLQKKWKAYNLGVARCATYQTVSDADALLRRCVRERELDEKMNMNPTATVIKLVLLDRCMAISVFVNEYFHENHASVDNYPLEMSDDECRV